METERYEKFHEVQVPLNASDASMITPFICGFVDVTKVCLSLPPDPVVPQHYF